MIRKNVDQLLKGWETQFVTRQAKQRATRTLCPFTGPVRPSGVQVTTCAPLPLSAQGFRGITLNWDPKIGCLVTASQYHATDSAVRSKQAPHSAAITSRPFRYVGAVEGLPV